MAQASNIGRSDWGNRRMSSICFHEWREAKIRKFNSFFPRKLAIEKGGGWLLSERVILFSYRKTSRTNPQSVGTGSEKCTDSYVIALVVDFVIIWCYSPSPSTGNPKILSYIPLAEANICCFCSENEKERSILWSPKKVNAQQTLFNERNVDSCMFRFR